MAASLIYISFPNFPWLLKENRDTKLMYGFDFIFVLADRVLGVHCLHSLTVAIPFEEKLLFWE